MRKKVNLFLTDRDLCFVSINSPMPSVLCELEAINLYREYPSEVEIAFSNFTANPPDPEESLCRAADLARLVNSAFDGYLGYLLLGPDNLPDVFLRDLKTLAQGYGIEVYRLTVDTLGNCWLDDNLYHPTPRLCPTGHPCPRILPTAATLN